jgi:hypothetical protein
MLADGVYSRPALVPASPWLESSGPGKPKLKFQTNDHDITGVLSWKPAGWEKISRWIIQARVDEGWETQILPENCREITLQHLPQIIAITAIDRCGVASPASALQLTSSK